MDIPDLNTLDEERVQQTLDFMTQRLAEFTPTLDSKRGVIKGIVLNLYSLLGESVFKVIEEEVKTASSLKLIAENPSETSTEMADLLLANFRVTRLEGSSATGSVTVVIDSLVPVTLSSQFQFEANGKLFQVDSSYAARITAGSVINETDRLIEQIGESEYAFSVGVVAVEEGPSSRLRRNDRLSPLSLIPRFVRAYAESDFSGGLETQNNEELISRLQEGLASKNTSNPTTTEALIHAQPEFESAIAISMIGYGDPEQIRYHTIFPGAAGGRVDVYVRTTELPESRRVTKTATLVEKRLAGSVWQFNLSRTEAAGCYDVEKVVLFGEDDSDQAGYEVLETINGFDLSDDGEFLPDVETAEEAAFSRYQTLNVRFLDTETDVSAMTIATATQDYDIVVRIMPQISDLQSLLGGSSARNRGGDILAKAPVPCFLGVDFAIKKKTGQEDPDLNAIKTDLAAYVNKLGFVGRLSASALFHVVHAHLSGGQTVSSINMNGTILRPNGTIKRLRSFEELIIPDEPHLMVTSRTVSFILDPVDVNASVSVAAFPDF